MAQRLASLAVGVRSWRAIRFRQARGSKGSKGSVLHMECGTFVTLGTLALGIPTGDVFVGEDDRLPAMRAAPVLLRRDPVLPLRTEVEVSQARGDRSTRRETLSRTDLVDLRHHILH